METPMELLAYYVTWSYELMTCQFFKETPTTFYVIFITSLSSIKAFSLTLFTIVKSSNLDCIYYKIGKTTLS